MIVNICNMTEEMSDLDVFITGTGRCGSTLLSGLLSRHPEILSLSEFFVMISDMGHNRGGLFPEREVDADYFRDLLSVPGPFLAASLRAQVIPDEYLYLRRHPRRFADTEVPPALLVALCLLADDPEALFDEMGEHVRDFPPARTDIHFRRLIGWLKKRLGRHISVERSASSISEMGTYTQVFPDAKVVHIVRDGRACALSMSRQANFRLMYVHRHLNQLLGYNPYETGNRSGAERLPEQWRALLPESFSRDVFRELEIPASYFGDFWSGQIAAGVPALRGLAPGQLLTIRYEDLVDFPERTLSGLIDFIGGHQQGPDRIDSEWVTACAATMRPWRPVWNELPEDELTALEKACEPGFAVLDGLRSRD
jgi:putative sulfotransferase